MNCCVCGKEVVSYWSYMPGSEDYCEDCVPRGCSCNSDFFEFDEDSVSKEKQIEWLLNHRKYKVLNYGSKEHERGKHLEEITDMNLIKAMLYNFTEEQLLHLELIPLDSKGREYPCCEYMFCEEDS